MNKDKNILIEVDEVTASLLDDINSDLTSDVKDSVRDLLEKSAHSTIESLQNLGEAMSDMHQQTKRSIDKCISIANSQIDYIEEIKDSIDNLTGLDKITGPSVKLSDFLDTTRERLSSIPAALDSSTDRVIGETKNCVSEAVSALDAKLTETSTNLTDSLDTTTERLSSIPAALDSSADRVIGETKNCVSEAVSALDAKLTETSAKLNTLTEIINQYFKDIESRLDTLDKKVNESHKALMDEISQRTDGITDRLDAIAADIEKSDCKALEARNESVSLLNKIIYLCTPFWKRGKGAKGQKD